MIKIFLALVTLLITISCSKNEVKFEAFSAEAFAYDIGDGIAEVNATVRVKGFTQTEKDDNYSAAVAYEVNLLKPDSTEIKSVFKYVQNAQKNEPISDIALESQFTLDSTYMAGTYTLIYKIEDKNSDNKLESKVNFDLTRE
ncbi:MAG: hypothetical protein IPJ23_15425 [Ignavibacteriales bacterium]|nr:hypothetical protein [Ignavibacteriales bacterium]